MSSENQKFLDKIHYLEKIFQKYAEGNEITLEQFRKVVKSKNPFFVDRIFRVFDRDESNTITQHEFVSTFQQIAAKTVEEKLRMLFQIYDINGDGTISVEEMRHVIRCSMEENELEFSDEECNDLADLLFEDADKDKTGTITFDEFLETFSKYPELAENLSASIEKWILPSPKPTSHPDLVEYFRKFTWKYWSNNFVSVIFFLCYLALNIGLFVTRGLAYADVNIYVALARACGQCLNFNCAFVLVLMLNKSLTLLRSTVFISILPIDQHIYYHKVVAWFIVFYSILHTAMHLCNFYNVALITSIPLEDYLYKTYLGIGWVGGTACVTGWILCIVLIIMVVSSMPFMRKSGHFEIFYYCHLLYVVFWIALIMHGPVFWKWFILPAIIFLIEKAYRIRNSFSAKGRTYVDQSVVLPSGVVHLIIKRPPNFDFNPGDFVLVQIPSIAKWEWHPFTISSAPEIGNHIWLHIRAFGEWTGSVFRYFKDQEAVIKRFNSKEDDYTYNVNLSIFKMSKMLCIPLGKQNPLAEQSESKNPSTPSSVAGSALYDGVLSPSFRSQLCAKRVAFDENEEVLEGNKVSSLHVPRGLRRTSTRNTMRNSKIFLLPRPGECKPDGSCGIRKKAPLEDVEAVNNNNNNEIMETSFTSPLAIGSASPAESVVSATTINNLTQGNLIRMFSPLRIRIDGPYGSPSSQIFHAEHAVMISAGIGVTPFASILQSIMFRYLKVKHRCPKCSHKFTDHVWSNAMKLRKVDFVWINRQQKSFEWFVNLLSELEITQAEMQESERFLDIYMYITSALQKSDMKAVGLHLALDLMHEKRDRDLITGLKTRTRPGRPDWDRFFQELSAQRKGKITVFYCGPPVLGRTIHSYCNDFGFTFRKENF